MGQFVSGVDGTGSTLENIGTASSVDNFLREAKANGDQSMYITDQFKGVAGQFVFWRWRHRHIP